MSVSRVTLDGLVRNAAVAHPTKTAIIDGDVRLTFDDFERLVDAFAAALRDRGVRKGQRVAALLVNQWEFSLTYFAVVRLGALIVPLNHRLVADELAFQVSDAGADTLIFATEFSGVVVEVARQVPIRNFIRADPTAAHDAALYGTELTSPAESLSEILDAYAGLHEPVQSEANHEDPSAVWYTSGTTGRPKGALVTHSSTLWAAASLALVTRMNLNSRLLAVAPMFHRGPTDTMHIACFMLGMTQTMLRNFSPEGLLDAIQQERATHAFIVPAMTHAVLNLPSRSTYDLTSMQCWMSASAPLPIEYRDRLVEETSLPPGRMYNAYGITEALLIATLTPEQADHAPSVGQAVPMCQIRILDGKRDEVGVGQIGEITVSTPAMAAGYIGNEEAWNAVTFSHDGIDWYASGDLGFLDEEGYLHIVDRSKDMVITGGENVYSAEVELTLVAMPGISEVAVIGTPDERWGEVVTAVIVRDPASAISAAEVEAFCAGRLAGYKRPRRVRFVDALPRNSFGKIRKDQLRQASSGWGY